MIAGRLLGPTGLGSVFIGFSGYQLALAMQRAFVTQPVVATSSAAAELEHKEVARGGLTGALLVAGAATCLVFAIGHAVGGPAGRGLLIFAPWLTPALLQEYWKAILFRDGRGAAAGWSELTRVVVMAIGIPLTILFPRDYLVVAVWGFSSTIALFVAFSALALSPLSPSASFASWRTATGSLSGWLGAREIVYQTSVYSAVLALAVLIGSDGLGGLRSAEALFSPFSLLAPAILLPALPALSRAVAASGSEARRLALKINVGAAAIAITYFALMALAGPWLLTHLFGSSFNHYRTLIWPMGVSQLINASIFAFGVLLMGQSRGRAILVVGLITSGATIIFPLLLGSLYGVTGAAWGYTVVAAATAIPLAFLGLRVTERERLP